MNACQKLNVISLWPKVLWQTKQSPSRRFYIRALGARENVQVHQTGPGFDDWGNSLTGMQNISRIMPDCNCVISYKALGGCDKGRVLEPLEVSRELLTVEQFNECWPGTTSQFGGVMHSGGGTVADECRRAGTRLVILHHTNDFHRVSSVRDYGAEIVHIPHGAHPMFARHALPWEQRSGVILTGSLNVQHYPIRQRWSRLIRRGELNATYFRRPSSYTKSPKISDKYVEKYAKALGSAKVKLGCASIWKYALQHYSEAALAGCAHVADQPEGGEFSLVEINNEMTDQELIDAVCEAYEAGDRIAARGLESVWTTELYAERLESEIRKRL